MENFAILVDSVSDLPKEYQEKYGIDVVYGHMTVDGKEMESLLDWSLFTKEEFFKGLKANPDNYTTAAPSIGEFAEKMESYAKEGRAVIFFSLSSKLSATFNCSIQAKKIVEDKYPDAKITCIDSMRYGMAIGLMAVNTSILRQSGKSYEETVEIIEKTRNTYHQAGWLDDLTFIAKKGRLTHSKAFFGTLVGVKPIGEFDYNGLTTVLGKAKGEKQAYEVLIKYMKQTVLNPENQIIFIAQADRKRQAEKYKEIIENELHPKEIHVMDVYASDAINVGPGLMAAYYTGTEISSDLERERNIIKEAIGG